MLRESDKKFQDLLSALETVLQQDHPNPNRVGCPPRSTLERLAQFSLMARGLFLASFFVRFLACSPTKTALF
jgi:hypothetical protein